MASGNARGEDKRWEDGRSATEKRNRFNKCSARGRRHRASVVDDDGGGGGRKRAKRLGARKVRLCERERERNGVCVTAIRGHPAPSASATERQQTHACATWSERSIVAAAGREGTGTRDPGRDARREWGGGSIDNLD